MATEPEARLVELKNVLKNKEMTLTPRRAKLLEVLVASDNHPTVSEMHADVSRYYPGTSLATIYNTIELLKEAEQIIEIEFSGAPNRYDGRRLHPHPHLICTQCDRVEDLDDVEQNESLDSISVVTGYAVTRRRNDYFGVCPYCQAKDQQTNNL